MEILTPLEVSLDAQIQTIVLETVTKIVPGISMLSASAITLWFAFKTYMLMTGRTGESPIPLFQDFGIKILILFIASSVALYNTYIVQNVQGTIYDLGSTFSDGRGVFAGFEENLGITLNKIIEKYSKTKGSWWGSIWPAIENGLKLVMVFLGLGYFIFKAAIAIIINKVIFAISLGVGPIFLFFLAFEKTRNWGWSWLSATLSYGFAFVMGSILFNAAYQILDALLFGSKVDVFTWSGSFTAIVLCFILAQIAARVGDVASQYFAGGGNISDRSSQDIGRSLAKPVAYAKSKYDLARGKDPDSSIRKR